jgi:flavorubredoxin
VKADWYKEEHGPLSSQLTRLIDYFRDLKQSVKDKNIIIVDQVGENYNNNLN